MIGRAHIAAVRGLLVAAPAQAQVTWLYPFGSPSQVQSTTVALDSSGNARWDFAPAFPAPPDITHMVQAMDTTNPITCNYTARTATYVSIHCWRANTLSALLGGLFSGSVTGAQVNPIARYRPN